MLTAVATCANKRGKFTGVHDWCDVGGSIWIGLSWIFGQFGVHGDAASRFSVDFAFEPDYNAHTNLKAIFIYTFPQQRNFRFNEIFRGPREFRCSGV